MEENRPKGERQWKTLKPLANTEAKRLRGISIGWCPRQDLNLYDVTH